MEYEVFLERFRKERKRRGVSLKEIHAATGIAISSISQAERGIRPLRMKDFFTICELMNVSPREFMEVDENSQECKTVAEQMGNLSTHDFCIVKDLVSSMLKSNDNLN